MAMNGFSYYIIVFFLFYANDCVSQISKSDSFISITVNLEVGLTINDYIVPNTTSYFSKNLLDSIIETKGRRRINLHKFFNFRSVQIPTVNIFYPKSNLGLVTLKVENDLAIVSIVTTFNSKNEKENVQINILGVDLNELIIFEDIYYNPVFANYIDYTRYANKNSPHKGFINLKFSSFYIELLFSDDCLRKVIIG